MLVLGIETSCDETAAAVVENGRTLRANVVATQEEIHKEYGGVVPELASRAHVRSILPVIHGALSHAGIAVEHLDGVAVTQGPGLVGALLVGLCAAKCLAFGKGIPLAGVDHLESHVMAAFLMENAPDFPFTALVVSGGHTNLYLVRDPFHFELMGRTRDDAAGEAFDKVAKYLNLGYPGGGVIDRLSREGNPQAVDFPRPMLDSPTLDFSFSGLKTAVVKHLKKHPAAAREHGGRADLVASFQEAVVDVLVAKSIRALERTGTERFVLAGGVAANSRLRERLADATRRMGVAFFVPPPSLCTDTAAGVAMLGWHHLREGRVARLDVDVYSRAPVPV